WEYEDGRVTQKVRPSGPHSTRQTRLAADINSAAADRKAAMALAELRSVFGRSPVYVPDVSGYRWLHIPRDGRGRVAAEAAIPLDVVFEVTSPSQSIPATRRKCEPTSSWACRWRS